jgi:hypothetical protein
MRASLQLAREPKILENAPHVFDDKALVSCACRYISFRRNEPGAHFDFAQCRHRDGGLEQAVPGILGARAIDQRKTHVEGAVFVELVETYLARETERLSSAPNGFARIREAEPPGEPLFRRGSDGAPPSGLTFAGVRGRASLLASRVPMAPPKADSPSQNQGRSFRNFNSRQAGSSGPGTTDRQRVTPRVFQESHLTPCRIRV